MKTVPKVSIIPVLKIHVVGIGNKYKKGYNKIKQWFHRVVLMEIKI